MGKTKKLELAHRPFCGVLLMYAHIILQDWRVLRLEFLLFRPL
jgi:hypothetical protein